MSLCRLTKNSHAANPAWRWSASTFQTERSVSVRPMRASEAQETCCDCCLRNCAREDGPTSSSKPARPSSAGDAVLVFCLRQLRDESRVSADHLPPTSKANTTRRARLPGPPTISALCAAWPEDHAGIGEHIHDNATTTGIRSTMLMVRVLFNFFSTAPYSSRTLEIAVRRTLNLH